MKNVKLKFNDTWVDVEDGWLCIGDSENQILLKPKFFNKLLQAINYTHCCEELVCDCELDYSTISKEIDDNKCTNCGLPIIAN